MDLHYAAGWTFIVMVAAIGVVVSIGYIGAMIEQFKEGEWYWFIGFLCLPVLLGSWIVFTMTK